GYVLPVCAIVLVLSFAAQRRQGGGRRPLLHCLRSLSRPDTDSRDAPHPLWLHAITRRIMSMPNQYPTLDFDLGETADQLRDTVRSFTADEIAPIAAEIDRTYRFPRELWPRMGALGLHGITVEEAYGGSGLGYLEHVVAMEEVSRGSASVGLSYGA